MSETATVTPPAAPAAVPNTQQPAVIVPPSNTINSSAEKARENAREARIKTAMAPKAAEPAKPVADAPAAPAKPVTAEAPKVFEKKPDAPVATAPEADPVDSMKLAANATPESVARFADLAKVAKERKTLVEAANRRIAELEAATKNSTTAAPAEAAEIERLRQEHKAAVDRLAVLDLQNHPDFTRQFVEPKKKALATASEVLQYNGKEGVELAPLLTKPLKDFNAAVSDFTKDMNTADAATVAQSLRDARSLHAQEQAQLSNSSELRTQLQSKAALEQKKAFEAVAGEIVPNFAKREITDGMDPAAKQAALEYNQSVETIRQRAEAKAFGKFTEKDVARMAFADVALDHMVRHAVPALERHVDSQNQLIASLTAELEGLRGKKSPDVSTAPRTTSGEPDLKKMTIEERVAYRLKQARRPAQA